jgi:hypothetical protein
MEGPLGVSFLTEQQLVRYVVYFLPSRTYR